MILKDCIYGYIKISDFIKKFIDVPQFQRLRYVKQLGVCHHVYPSAVHSRLEHCLGTMHLSGVVVDHINSLEVTKKISSREKQLIQLAGLYHDIGHYAYSHFFDSLAESKLEDGQTLTCSPHHESRSVSILQEVNDKLQELTQDELEFAKVCILGNANGDFRYQIVNNKQCGIDVDKMDYLYRDAYHTNFPNFQSEYIINCIRIKDDTISFLPKAKGDLKQLFHTRKRMHQKVYQHGAAKKIEKIYWCMIKKLWPEIMKMDKPTDLEVDYLIRHSDDQEIKNLLSLIDNRCLQHDCERCQDYVLEPYIVSSGKMDDIIWV